MGRLEGKSVPYKVGYITGWVVVCLVVGLNLVILGKVIGVL